MLRPGPVLPKGASVGVRVLFVEDSQDDVELQLRRLREAGLEPQWDRVQTEDALRAALADEAWEIALVDYNIPGFSGLEALRLIAELSPDLPAITVSGSIDEDTAVATMSAGAVEYVLKDNLTRLAPAVRRAIDAAVLRRAHRHSAEAARLALFAVDHASQAILTIAEDGTIVYVNDAACRVAEAEREVVIGSKLWEVVGWVTSEEWSRGWAHVLADGVREVRIDRARRSGERLVMDVTMNYLEGADLIIAYGRDVTGHVVAEERARESDALYRRIVDMAAEGIWVFDAANRVVFANPQMAHMLGYEAEEMLGRPDRDFTYDDDAALLEARRQARMRLEPGRYDARFRARDGSPVWLAVNSVADSDASGTYAGAFTVCSDITERKRADDALRAERANLAAIFEASPVAMLVFDERLNVVRVNRAALALARGDVGDLLDHEPGSTVQCGEALGCAHCGDDPRGCGDTPDCPLCPLRNGIEAVLCGGTSLRGVELALQLRRDGEDETVWLRMGAEPLALSGAPHITVALDDITQAKQAESALRESEERFKRFAERIPGFVSIKDAEHRYLYLSRLFDRDDLEASDDLWQGKRPGELWSAEDAGHIDAVAGRALAGDVVDEVVTWKHGAEERHFHALHFPIPCEGGPPLVGGLTLDVTEQVQAEAALRESEERFEQFAEHFPGYFFMHDADLRYVFVNRREEQDGDLRRGEWLGRAPSDLWEGDEIAVGDERLRRARDGEVVDVVQPWSRSGRQEYLHSIYFPIPRGNAAPLIGGLSLDVTDQVEAEEEVRRSAEQLRRTLEGAVLAMSQVVETRDPYTAGHERRVSELATAIGREMGLGADALEGLRLAALIHDIGKISVPAEILAKPGRLSEVEFNLIKQHVQAGYDILAPIDFGRPVAEIVLQHHERLDGSGYPRGLSGEEFLQEARILSVADVVEAMSSHRPYRPAMGMHAALEEVREGAGSRYDGEVAAACIEVVEGQGFEFVS